MTQPIQTLEQHIYLAKLLGYDYTIQYTVEHSNVVVDALSRIHEPSSEAFWILTVLHFQFLDDHKRELFQTEDHPKFKIRDDQILYKWRIWLNKVTQLSHYY